MLEVGITALGGVIFGAAMLIVRGSVVAAIGMHAGMNAIWEVFSIGPDAVGTRDGLYARAIAIVAGIALAFLVHRLTASTPAPAPVGED